MLVLKYWVGLCFCVALFQYVKIYRPAVRLCKDKKHDLNYKLLDSWFTGSIVLIVITITAPVVFLELMFKDEKELIEGVADKLIEREES